MLFQPDVETMEPAARAELQVARLRALVARLRASSSPYWSAKLAGVEPSSIRSIEDLASLPLTTKAEMRDQFPFGMLAVPLADTVRIHASSGTRGKPTIVAYTRADIDIFAEVNARSIACAGGTRDDVLHVAYGYGLFTGGLGLRYGGERLGATVVPASGGNPPFQLQLMTDLGATGLACTPSFAMLLAERRDAEGIGREILLRFGVFGAEPWSDSLRAKLEDAWGIDACDIYGLSEIIGPGVAMECREGKGAMHVFSDHFVPEVVDPGSGERCGPGVQGELVLTTVTKEALPVIRYRTGDVTSLIAGSCPCGRTFPRIARFSGRVDDMLVVRGVNVFPSEIEAVVLEDAELAGHYLIVLDRRKTLAELEVRAELVSAELMAGRGQVESKAAEALQRRLKLRTSVRVGPPDSLPRSQVGKARRVFVRDGDEDPAPFRAR
jgi:phenylacetate-CoA ligase